MAAVTICSDFGAPQNKVWHCFHCFPIYRFSLLIWFLNLSLCYQRFLELSCTFLQLAVLAYHDVPVAPTIQCDYAGKKFVGTLSFRGRKMLWRFDSKHRQGSLCYMLLETITSKAADVANNCSQQHARGWCPAQLSSMVASKMLLVLFETLGISGNPGKLCIFDKRLDVNYVLFFWEVSLLFSEFDLKKNNNSDLCL